MIFGMKLVGNFSRLTERVVLNDNDVTIENVTLFQRMFI